MRLDPTHELFHLCSHGSRDPRRGAEPWLEGTYALRQRETRSLLKCVYREQLDLEALDAGSDKRAELPTFTARIEADVSRLRKSVVFEPPSKAAQMGGR
jgi:hypothetical protein